jgi:hypothetical protein
MMAGATWLAAFVFLPVVGAPLLAHPAFGRFPFGSRVILAAGAGAAFLSLSMTLFTLADRPWGIAAVAVLAALLASASRVLLRGEGETTPPDLVRPDAVERLAGVIACIAVLAALAATLGGAATSADLVFFWGAKAQQFAAARGVDTEFLRDPAYQYMHPYYPPLVANVFAFATMAAGRFVWTAAALTFPLALGALAAALPGVLRLTTSARAAAATSALVVATLACIGSQADVAGNADMPLLLFETLAMALLLGSGPARASGDLLAGILFAAAATAKVEGLPFALAATAIALVLRGGPAAERGKAALRLLGPTALSLAAWFAFGMSRNLFSDYSEYGRFFDIHVGHAPGVAAEILRALASTGRGMPYLIPLLCLIAAGRRGRMAALPLGTAAALAAFLVFTYLHLTNDPTQWIDWSAARVFAPLPVLFTLAAACRRQA